MDEALTEQQSRLTLHLHNCIEALMQTHFFNAPTAQRTRRSSACSLKEVGIDKIRNWSIRFEFQSRGTPHVHGVMWADLSPGVQAASLTGRSGERSASPLLQKLEHIFKCRVDVQCGDGTHNVLRYCAGYVQKASDAMHFYHAEAAGATGEDKTTWRQTYRLLCKRSPQEQEMTYRGSAAGTSIVPNKRIRFSTDED
eukprot:6490264-Amphidinium_carterae.3